MRIKTFIGPSSLLLASLACATAGAAELGREIAIPRHLADGEELTLSTEALLAHGRDLFAARWTTQEGAGRPLMNGTGRPLADDTAALVFPRNFNRISGPDANSCAACHHQPRAGGAGDSVANVFVLAQRLDFATFDLNDLTALRGSRDEAQQALTLQTVGNERNTVGMFGAGYIEMLARQFTWRFRRLRDTLEPGERVALSVQGLDFGVLARHRDGRWDTTRIDRLPPPSLATTGPDDPPSLIVRPFHQTGAVVSLREFSNNAFNHHHGIQSTERFGDSDADGDGHVAELTRADVTAATVYQAALAVPGRIIPRDPRTEQAVRVGERSFAAAGCADCHTPALKLYRSGWHFTEPNPYNPPGNLQRGDAPTIGVDLDDPALDRPRLRPQGAYVEVPAFTDFRLHDITTGPTDPACEPLNQHFPPGSPKFLAGNCRFLTSRLWGVADTAPYMHHGKYTTMREAIEAHAGEAGHSRAAWRALSGYERDAVIEFLKTLRILPPGTRHRIVDEALQPREWPPFTVR